MVVLQEIASLSTLHHDNGRHLDVDCTACSLGCRHFDTSTTATYVQTVFKISSSVRPHVFTPSKKSPWLQGCHFDRCRLRRLFPPFLVFLAPLARFGTPTTGSYVQTVSAKKELTPVHRHNIFGTTLRE